MKRIEQNKNWPNELVLIANGIIVEDSCVCPRYPDAIWNTIEAGTIQWFVSNRQQFYCLVSYLSSLYSNRCRYRYAVPSRSPFWLCWVYVCVYYKRNLRLVLTFKPNCLTFNGLTILILAVIPFDCFTFSHCSKHKVATQSKSVSKWNPLASEYKYMRFNDKENAI